jgi:hypothetical protein
MALIVFGAFVAGARDLSFDARGYGVVFLANITTALYLATINRIGKLISSMLILLTGLFLLQLINPYCNHNLL